jgi:hypothetical protein
MIDEYSYGTGGNYWVSAYGKPLENDLITDENNFFIGTAHNVGIFTFNIVQLNSNFIE